MILLSLDLMLPRQLHYNFEHHPTCVTDSKSSLRVVFPFFFFKYHRLIHHVVHLVGQIKYGYVYAHSCTNLQILAPNIALQLSYEIHVMAN